MKQKPFIKMLILSTIFLMMYGCSSPISRARKLADNGAYDEALVIYDRLAEKDSDDVDVILERKKIRLKLLERRLVDARLSRMGGRMPESAEILRDVYQKYLTWKEPQSAPALSTWEEEIDELMKFVSQEIKQALSKNYPLRASYLFQRYNDLLRTRFSDLLEMESKNIQNKGKQSCLDLIPELKRSTQFFEYSKFLQTYCTHFNTPFDLKPVMPSAYALNFYGKINRTMDVDHLPENLVTVFSSEIENQFKESAYYDSASENTLKVHVNGSVNVRESTNRYTEIATITETRGPDPKDPQKKVYEVRRPFPYLVNKTVYSATFNPTFEIRIDPRRNPLIKTFNRSESFESIWHQTYLPEANIYPIPKSKPNFETWYGNQIKEAVGAFSEILNTHWAATFCANDRQDSKVEVPPLEQYFRCLKDRKNVDHEFVKNPFQSQFGVTPKEAFEVL